MHNVNDVYQINKKWNYPTDPNLFCFLSSGTNQEQTEGFVNANGDYSASPTRFKIQAVNDTQYHIFRILVSIGTTGKFNSGKYGNDITLTNGIKLLVNGNNIVQDSYTLTAIPIILTTDWQIYCYDFNLSDFGVGENHGSVRWTFSKGGLPIPLEGWENKRLEILLEDDFRDLEHHYFQVQGAKFDRNFT